MDFINFILQFIHDYFPILERYPWIIATLICCIGLLLNYKKIFEAKDFLTSRERVRLENILSSNYVQDDVKATIIEILSEKYFYIATGLNINSSYRKDFMEIYHKNNCSIELWHFKNIRMYIQYKNGKLIGVKIPFLIEFFWITMIWAGLNLILTAFFGIFSILNNKNILGINFLLHILTIFILSYMGTFLISKVYSFYQSAKIVNRKIGGNEIFCFYKKAQKKSKLCMWLYIILLLFLVPFILFFINIYLLN